jgi:hypothetical protein
MEGNRQNPAAKRALDIDAYIANLDDGPAILNAESMRDSGESLYTIRTWIETGRHPAPGAEELARKITAFVASLDDFDAYWHGEPDCSQTPRRS